MRKSIVVWAVVMMAVLLGGCSSGAQSQPYSSSSMTIIGTTGGGGSTPASHPASPLDPVAVERIPAGSGVLAHITGGAPRISDARAMAIARKAGVTSGAKSASAVHVMLSSDVSRPTNPLAGTGAVSAWMVTFHGVKLPKNGTTAGETGSSTVFLNAETGKVIRVLNYVPTPVN